MNPLSYKKRVVVLRGGPSSEYDVSMQTGRGVLSALESSHHDARDIIISKTGEWLEHGYVKSPDQILLNTDVVFIALHGAYGEDGTVQRILERMCIPYTGSSSFSSAVAINKALTKDYLKRHSDKIKMAPHLKVSSQSLPNLEKLTATIKELFGPEYVIKPISGGSSIGTVIVNQYDLLKSLQSILQNYDEVMVEKRIKGKEATVGIIEAFRGQAYYQLPAIEIVPPASQAFFTEDAKYSGQSDEICPGRFSRSEKDALHDIAKDVHHMLRLRQYSRSDFIVADDGIYFLEVNTLPGLTAESLFPKALEAVGSSYNELIEHLIATAY